jgi:hypothetical protein
MPVNEMNQAKAEEFAERMIGILNSGANVARSRLYQGEVKKLPHDFQNIYYIIKKN